MKTLMILIFAFGGLLLASIVIRAQHERWMCELYDQSRAARSGRPAEWDSAAYGWKDIPPDLGSIPIDLLPADPAFTSAYDLMWSPSAQELWVFPLWSFDARPDTNGQHWGQHDLCQVVIYTLKS